MQLTRINCYLESYMQCPESCLVSYVTSMPSQKILMDASKHRGHAQIWAQLITKTFRRGQCKKCFKF